VEQCFVFPQKNPHCKDLSEFESTDGESSEIDSLRVNSCFPPFVCLTHLSLLNPSGASHSAHSVAPGHIWRFFCFDETLMKLGFLGFLCFWLRGGSRNTHCSHRETLHFLIIQFSKTESSHNEKMFHLTSK